MSAARIMRVALAALALVAPTLHTAVAQSPPPGPAANPTQVGDRFYCQDRALGTWFYCDRPKAEEAAPMAPAAPPQTAAQQR